MNIIKTLNNTPNKPEQVTVIDCQSVKEEISSIFVSTYLWYVNSLKSQRLDIRELSTVITGINMCIIGIDLYIKYNDLLRYRCNYPNKDYVYYRNTYTYFQECKKICLNFLNEDEYNLILDILSKCISNSSLGTEDDVKNYLYERIHLISNCLISEEFCRIMIDVYNNTNL